MTSIKMVQIIVERDPMTKISKDVPAWYVDVYAEKYPEKLEIVDQALVADVDDLPDVQEEYDRMQQFFGADVESGQSYLGLVYGRGRDGATNLAKAMQAAVVGADKGKKVAAKKEAAQPADSVDAGASTDPLDDPK